MTLYNKKGLIHKIPLKILIKDSSKLFIIFLLGALLITSISNFNLHNLIFQAISLSSLFIIIFFINTALLYYFDKRRKNPNEKIWKKTFAIGYFISLLFFFLHHILINFLEDKDLISIPRNVEIVTGWKLIFFILYASFVVYSFIFFIQNFVLNAYEKNRIQVELIKVKASNSEAINQLLQQQIQPHFLFNALNILKSLIRKDPSKAEIYLLRLSDFLRVSISKNTSGVATIAEELKVCKDYMEMQKIRFGEALIFEVEISENDSILQHKLPFFSLQSLLENAIKHNELTRENPLKIQIFHEDDYIIVRNNLQPKSYHEISTGKGHNMLKERYKILADDTIRITINNNFYDVHLKILK